jgi:hypothetical protein
MGRLSISVFIFLFIIGCGKQHFPDYSDNLEAQMEQEEVRYYKAQFFAINSNYKTKGHALLWIKENQFYVRIVMTKGQPLTIYKQFIHKGQRCPDRSADLNSDGALDISEVTTFSGEILIPLDREVKSDDLGSEWFPESSDNGTYYYSSAADYNEFMKNLRHLQKLSRSEKLELGRRVIVLYGSATDPLLPIACAEIYEDFQSIH